ncbi:MAG: hypothetical protein IKD04_08270 [Clostridia bacterium]|nr:hypothetical protein [Clostridia bacterium]
MKIVSVFKTHFDIGFTDLSENIMKNICTDMLDRVIELCEKTGNRPEGKKYVWTMPSEPLRFMLESDYVSEEKREKLIDFINRGQVVWHSLPFTLHTDFCGLDELIYGINISKKLSERFNKSYVSAKMTDVPGHSRYLPTILSAAGIKFLHLGCNPACTPPDVPPLFWWEGPDGSRVLTMYAKGGYGSGVNPPADWKYSVWLAMNMTNDNIGPHTIDVLDEMEAEAKLYDENAEIFCGTLDDFYYALLPQLGDIPVIKKDLADTWIHGVGTYPEEVSQIRDVRQKVSALQNLYNLLVLSGKAEENDLFNEKIETALHNILMFGEHTWGCDVKTFLENRVYSKPEFLKWLDSDGAKFAEKSWNEQRRRAEDAKTAAAEAEQLLKAAVNDTFDGIAVYSNGSEIGECWIPVESGSVYQDKHGVKLTTFSGIGGDELYLPIIRNSEIYSFEKCIGAVTKQNNVEVKNTDGSIVITTPYHKAIFCEADGSFNSLTDVKTGHSWINGSATLYRYDVYGTEDIAQYQKDYIYQEFDWILKDLGRVDYPEDLRHKPFFPLFDSLKIRENGESAEVTITYNSDKESFESYGNAEKILVKFIFYGYKPQIDVECELINKQSSPVLESGHFMFPLCDGRLDFCFDKLGSVVHPAEDIIENANTALYCAESFIHAQAESCGITLITNDTPLFSLGDIGIFKYYEKFERPENNTVYFNLFNNQWGTNFPQWISGDYKYRYSIFTHKGNEAFGVELARKYYEKPYVLTGSRLELANINPFSLPCSVKLLEFKMLKPNTYLLVLKECMGKSHEGRLNFNAFKAVYRSNLSACKGEQIDLRYTQQFEPWSINCYLCEK